MVIAVCVISGIASALWYKKAYEAQGDGTKPAFKKSLYIKLILLNLILSAVTYAYYIGYAREVVAALFHMTRNSLYFACISIGWCVVLGFLFIKQESIRNSIQRSRRAVDYNITSLDKVAFYIIVVVAFAVRVIGYDWGAGMTFHPDESEVTHYPEIMAENNTMLSGGVYYPAQISGKLLAVLYELYGMICGWFHWSCTQLNYNHIARLLIAMFSLGIVVCVYYIGNHLKKHAGTVAALLAALFPPFVQMAHCVTGDPIVAFFACLLMLCAFYYYAEEKKVKWVVLMSILAAMAGLEKYNGAVLCGFIAIVVISDSIQKGSVDFIRIIREGIIAIVSVMGTIVLLVPNLVVHYKDVLDGLLYVTYGFEEDGSNTFMQNFYQYMIEFTSYAGLLCFVLLLSGIVILLWSHRKEYCVFSSGLLVMIVMCMQNRAFLRWGYVFYVCFIVIIGIAIMTLYNYIRKQRYAAWTGIFGIVIGLIFVNNASGTILIDTVYANSGQDIRVASGEWCAEQGIEPLDCIYDNYTCFNPGGIAKNQVEWITINERMQKIDDWYIVNTLGRRYAITNISRNGKEDCLKAGIELVAFEPTCPFDGFSVDLYHEYSRKIYEGYSIWYSLRMSKAILDKEAYFGSETRIYDISAFPAYQEFPREDFEEHTAGDVQGLSTEIRSISEGEHWIEIDGYNNGRAIVEDAQGNIVCQLELRSGYAEFEIQQQLYHANIVLQLEEDAFERVFIKSRN